MPMNVCVYCSSSDVICHGFYDSLIVLFDHFIEHPLAKPKHRALYDIVTYVDQMFEVLDSGQ